MKIRKIVLGFVLYIAFFAAMSFLLVPSLAVWQDSTLSSDESGEVGDWHQEDENSVENDLTQT